MYGLKCVIRNRSVQQLHSHHLFSKKAFSELQFCPLNGISIDIFFHLDFHHKYGFTTTIDDFISYIETLEFVSEIELDCSHLNDLKNWLYEIKPILQSRLNENNLTHLS